MDAKNPVWCRSLQESQAEHASISASLASANSAAEASKAAAAERQKRFSLLNSQFKRQEQALLKQLADEQVAGASAKAEVQKLNSQQGSHEKVCPRKLLFSLSALSYPANATMDYHAL